MADADPFQDVVALAQDLIRCQSVTPVEGGALSLLGGRLSALGFECHRVTFSDENTPDVENLYARIGHTGPNLVYAGHTDVVPVGDEAAWTYPPFGAEIHGDILYGRGAVDMKGGIAAFVAGAARYLAENNGQTPGSISLLITGDEEGPAINGTVKLLQWAKENGHSFDHCVVGEPTNVEALGDMIKIGRRGSFSGTITVTGQQGHVAYPHLAKNPISEMARMIELLTFEPLDAGSEHFQPTNLEIVNLDSFNRAWNVIPGKAELRFNIRFNDHWDASKLEQMIRQRMAGCANKTGLEITLAVEPIVSDVFLTEPGPLVDILTSAIHDVTGVQPKLSTNGGTSDARFIKDYCPVIEFGLVNKTIHQTDEHVSLDDLRNLTEIYYRMISGYFSKSEA